MPRRRVRRRFAGRKSGRRFFWFRFEPFSVTNRQAATATHADIFLSESQWQDPTVNLNEQARGGARLERLIVDFGLAVDAQSNFWRHAASANIALIPEFMIWKQSDQFLTSVTDSSTFDGTRADARVVMCEIPHQMAYTLSNVGGDPIESIVSVTGHYETKSKVRLSDGALGIAWRGNFNTGDSELEGYTDWVRPTVLMSTP